MPVTYSIDPNARIIRTACVGNVTPDDVANHFLELQGDPACTGHLDVLLDLSQLTSLPETNQLSGVAIQLKQTLGKVQFDAFAVVASRDSVYGMLRMFEVMVEKYFRATHVFRERGEAEAWLVSQKVHPIP